jgi:hypothetical protein
MAKGGEGSGDGGDDVVMEDGAMQEDVIMQMEEEKEEDPVGDLSQSKNDGGSDGDKEMSRAGKRKGGSRGFILQAANG